MPSEGLNKSLMRAVAEAAIFAGLSGDDVIREDAAVAFLEQLASTLKELEKPERAVFGRYVTELAAEEGAAGQTERAEFLSSLLENLGLDN